jgi:Zn-dependent M28 family amino/carboxypeptidase
MSDPIPDLIAQVDAERIRETVLRIAQDPIPFRKLNYTVPGHETNTLYEADAIFAAALAGWGYDVQREGVQVQAFRCDTSKPKSAQYSPPAADDPWYTAYNLYARRTGTAHPDEIILLIAHKDSQSWVNSPGANDNAVGTAGVLEMARVLAGYSPQRSLCFLLCNEEHVPWTSVTAAQNARERGDNLIAIFNLDGLGRKSVEDTEAGRMVNWTVLTEAPGEPLADLVAWMNETYAIGLQQHKAQRGSPGDDDGSFIKAGYSAAVINIGSWPYGDPNYHAEGDTPDTVDAENAALAVRAILAAVVTLDREGL